jgi:hypothetical protein
MVVESVQQAVIPDSKGINTRIILRNHLIENRKITPGAFFISIISPAK